MKTWNLLEVQGCVFCVNAENVTIAQIHPNEDQSTNARLIAAAPDLVEALGDIFAADDSGNAREVWAAIDRARAALAKAGV